MKKVLLIGDSIRIWYQNEVARLLGDEAEVLWRAENQCFTKFAIWSFDQYIFETGIQHFDCIHWNTGIWDIGLNPVDGHLSTLDEYLHDTDRLRRHLACYSDKLIFSTITPVGEGFGADQTIAVRDTAGTGNRILYKTAASWNPEVERYNAAAVQLLSSKGVVINDLHGLIASDPARYISNDTVHLSECGVSAAGRQIADAIRSVL